MTETPRLLPAPLQAPWPFYTQKAAAKRLGLSVATISGLANNPLPAIKVWTMKGNTILLFQREAIDRAERQIRRSRR